MKMAEDYFGASELGIFKLKISNNRNLAFERKLRENL